MSKRLVKIYTDAGYKRLKQCPIYLGMVVELDEAICNHRVINQPALSSTFAEYIALIWAMVYCLRIEEYRCHFLCDNQTMVRQIQGKYKVHKVELKILYDIVRNLWGSFELIEISHISGKINKAHKEVKKCGS